MAPDFGAKEFLLPCMCGDTRCWSCGPAQGNYHCHICGLWEDEGGCVDPDKCEESKRLERLCRMEEKQDYPF